MRQPPQLVLVEIDGRQAFDVRLGLGHGVQFIRHAPGRDVVLFVPRQEPDRPLKVLRGDHLPVQQVVLVRLLERQGPAQAQAERLHARLQPLEEARLEDADQTFFPALLELVLLLVGDGRFFLVRLQLVRRQGERLDGRDDLAVQPAVGRPEVVGDGVQLTVREGDRLALDRGVGVGRPDVGPGVADHDLFEQVEQDHAGRHVVLADHSPGPAEIGVEVADARFPEVVGPVLREEADLVRQVVQVIVDRRGREQDHLLVVAVSPAAAVELDQRVEGQVAVRLVVAEVVRLVQEDHVGVAVGRGVERVPAKLLHADDLGGDGGAGQFSLPHVPKRGGADDDGLLAAVVGEIFEQLLADPGLAQADGVRNQHAVVAGQDAAGLLDSVLLELGEVHGAAAQFRSVLAQLFLEILVQRLGVDLVGRVLLRAELAGVEQLDEGVLEIHRIGPLALVPAHQVGDGPGADLALDEAAGLVRDIDAARLEQRLRVQQLLQVTRPLRRVPVHGLLGR